MKTCGTCKHRKRANTFQRYRCYYGPPQYVPDGDKIGRPWQYPEVDRSTTACSKHEKEQKEN